MKRREVFGLLFGAASTGMLFAKKGNAQQATTFVLNGKVGGTNLMAEALLNILPAEGGIHAHDWVKTQLALPFPTTAPGGSPSIAICRMCGVLGSPDLMHQMSGK
jgi:hypothetical protein